MPPEPRKDPPEYRATDPPETDPFDSHLLVELEKLALEKKPTTVQRLLRRAFEVLGSERAVLSSGLGMEGCALMDMAAPLDLPMRVVFLDTGCHFQQTLELLDRLARRYSRLAFDVVEPERETVQRLEEREPSLWLREPNRCCHVRKVLPLEDRLRSADLWISAIGGSQSEAREIQPTLAATSRFGIPKLSPLRHWRRREVWAYVQKHDVPFNDLHRRGYPSIGCRHCTVPVPDIPLGEYSRAGRWATSQKTECGLHGSPASESTENPRLPLIAP